MKNCPVCDKKMTSESQDLGTYRCEHCGHRYRDYQGDNFEFQKKFHLLYRRNKNEITAEGKIAPVFHKARHNIVHLRLDMIRPYLDKSYIAFDIGAGAGTFAQALKPHVKRVDCLEIEDFLVEEIRRLGFYAIQQDFLEMPLTEQYDLVFAWHVLEHVEDIDLFLRKTQLLTRNYFIMEIPTRRPFKPVYEGHIHYFSEKSLYMKLEEYFNVITIQSGVQAPAYFAVCSRRT